ncbi:hypothetical protein LH407_09100 [Antiquaquibacter oligotrophicus]|uniref:hypothetical protein n=1 Tax=Antiquaquibacter oligotrophicus TaxID=2880260 RepID=UPI002AC9BF94|nr:hypothetical protein [Antiquaquibacter oligotrophicus]UDF12320.1 hypothetical protein LH407_09100 [Antiquaquibacter oligotrophicus]
MATAFLAYLAARRVDEIRSSARTVWYTILVVSLTLIWSYPMVIATMYGAVDSLDVELFDYSLALGVVYWAAVVISLVAAPVSALNLFLARAQRTRTYKR